MNLLFGRRQRHELPEHIGAAIPPQSISDKVLCLRTVNGVETVPDERGMRRACRIVLTNPKRTNGDHEFFYVSEKQLKLLAQNSGLTQGTYLLNNNVYAIYQATPHETFEITGLIAHRETAERNAPPRIV